MRDSDVSAESQAEQPKARAALYIDGFNLYHAIDDLAQPHLKWLNYWKLGEIIIPKQTEELVRVTYCTAYYPGDPKKKWRHEQVIGAQKVFGVDVVLGHYVREDMDCRACGNQWQKPTEKEGDINVAIHLLRDGFLDHYDHAYLLTADSDQAATARMFNEQFPNKRLTSVVPPRRQPSVHITNYTDKRKIALNDLHLERCVMPQVVFKPGVANTRRPNEYAPPNGWVHPDQRPK